MFSMLWFLKAVSVSAEFQTSIEKISPSYLFGLRRRRQSIDFDWFIYILIPFPSKNVATSAEILFGTILETFCSWFNYRSTLACLSHLSTQKWSAENEPYNVVAHIAEFLQRNHYFNVYQIKYLRSAKGQSSVERHYGPCSMVTRLRADM